MERCMLSFFTGEIALKVFTSHMGTALNRFNDKGNYSKTRTTGKYTVHNFNGKIDTMLKRGLGLL